MSVEDTRTVEKNEQILVGVIIEVYRNTKLPEKYKGIFHGETDIKKGKYTYWYPVKNTSYSRMVNELNWKYGMKVRYGIAGTMEI